MKLNLEFREFRALKAQIGARESLWRMSRAVLNERQTLIAELEEGKEIPLEEVEAKFGGLLSYKGESVVLYIRDTRQDKSTLLHDIEKSRRFHVFECQTLQEMRSKGRFERYVVTTRRDGKFLVEATDRMTRLVEEIEAPLAVCKNCLYELDWKDYARLNRPEVVWEKFSLQDFFAEFATFFASKPQYSDETAPQGGYAKNWLQIATKIKEQRNWQCEGTGCRVKLADHRSLLHAHHKNGVISDNQPSNIEVLCILCHSKQPFHEWMKPSITDRLQIESLRRRQHGH